jgi:enoyl-CoA hydratase/carnithine racemase
MASAEVPVSTDHIRVSSAAGVTTITLARPDKRNALTLAMYATITRALIEAANTPGVRVVQLRGSGGHFSAGNDLQDFQRNPPTEDGGPVLDFLQVLATFPLPLVAAVRGSAVGVGTTMLLHCDLVYVAPEARLQLPFVNLGLVPEAASSLLLPAMLGHVRAAELVMLGEPFSGEEAVALGLANQARRDPEAAADAACERLARQPPTALRTTKFLLKAPLQDAVAAAMHNEGVHFLRQLRSPEFAEAAAAFLQKRAPDFSRFS